MLSDIYIYNPILGIFVITKRFLFFLTQKEKIQIAPTNKNH